MGIIVKVQDTKVGFIHIPHTAGASITYWLMSVANLYGYDTHENYQHCTLNELLTLDNEIETFSVIRNPWDRVVSQYCFFKKMHNLAKESIDPYISSLVNVKLTDDGCYPSFDDWLSGIDSYYYYNPQDGKEARSWITPKLTQSEWIKDDPTYTLRYERLDEDFVIIQDIFKCNVSLPVINKNKSSDYRSFYNNRTYELVACLHKEDIDRWNYTF
jgi:hypothetical protein